MLYEILRGQWWYMRVSAPASISLLQSPKARMWQPFLRYSGSVAKSAISAWPSSLCISDDASDTIVPSRMGNGRLKYTAIRFSIVRSTSSPSHLHWEGWANLPIWVFPLPFSGQAVSFPDQKSSGDSFAGIFPEKDTFLHHYRKMGCGLLLCNYFYETANPLTPGTFANIFECPWYSARLFKRFTISGWSLHDNFIR